jgi:hypothetical protein
LVRRGFDVGDEVAVGGVVGRGTEYYLFGGAITEDANGADAGGLKGAASLGVEGEAIVGSDRYAERSCW